MKKNIYHNQNYMCIKAIMVLLLLSVPSIISCQGKNNNETGNNKPVTVESGTIEITKDPFLFCYFLNSPTIRFDESANVVRQRIEYKDFDQKEINYGDAPDGTEMYSIFLYQNRGFCGIENVVLKDNKISRTKETEILFAIDGSIAVNTYQRGTNRLSRQDAFKWNNNLLIANEGERNGRLFSILVKEETGYLYFSNHSEYNENNPSRRIIFNDNETILFRYNILINGFIEKYYYQNGILMKIEYNDGNMAVYTVSSGNGEIVTTDKTGTVTERARLERKVNESGYLVYESVRYQKGHGYEYFITKDKF